MIRIISPSDMRPEREYVYRVIFEIFLGVEYQLEFSSGVEIEVICGGSKFNFPDTFFQSQSDSWLTKNYQDILDVQPDLSPPQWSRLESVCSLFGSKCSIEETQVAVFLTPSNDYDFTFDLFGAVFFLLSRYEEHVEIARDLHNRFPFEKSVLYEYELISRPLVNEYVQLLRDCIACVLPNLELRKHKFKQVITCDIDYLRYPAVSGNVLKLSYFVVQILKGNGIVRNACGFIDYAKTLLLGYKYDRFNQFELIASRAKETGSEIVFYLMTGVMQTSQDGDYALADLVKTGVINELDKHKVKIGLHGGYQSFDNAVQLTEEKRSIEGFLNQYSGLKLVSSRQHYLRWAPGVTAESLSQAGLTHDSTMGYAECVGFRSSCCYEYPIFSLPERREILLTERPLMVMDVTLLHEKYMGISKAKNAIEAAQNIKKQVKRFGGVYTVLWHNSSLNSVLEKEVFFGITGDRS